jgi:hypothetical protein
MPETMQSVIIRVSDIRYVIRMSGWKAQVELRNTVGEPALFMVDLTEEQAASLLDECDV